jgi:N-acetyl-alpha-D-muramate 1-phosphate uridylyltransferase
VIASPRFRPTHAMVLAAGLGLRMRPLTLTTPKPLLSLAGRTVLDRALDHLTGVGVTHIVVNAHWLAERIVGHLAGRAGISVVTEPDLLETGGGVANALPLLGDQPFFVVNGDVFWTDGAIPALDRLAGAWDDARLDGVLLMQRTATAVGYEGAGDFFLDPAGVPRRRRDREVAPLLFGGIQLLHPRLFADAPRGAFSLNRLYDRALDQGRLAGIVHDGRWYHLGSPDILPAIETLLADEDG